MKDNDVKNSNLKKAIFVLLYDQFHIPDMEYESNDCSYIDYIISVLIEKNENRCPFKCYDCIGKCKDNMIGCEEGLKINCLKKIEEIWKEFIDIENVDIN